MANNVEARWGVCVLQDGDIDIRVRRGLEAGRAVPNPFCLVELGGATNKQPLPLQFLVLRRQLA